MPARFALRTALVSSVFVSLAFAAGCPANKAQFIEMSYPNSISDPAPSDAILTMYASSAPALIAAYRQPQLAGECLRALVVRDQQSAGGCLPQLWKHGACLDGGMSWRECVRDQAKPWLLSTAGTCPVFAVGACKALEGRDVVRMARSLLDFGQAVYHKELARQGQAQGQSTVLDRLEQERATIRKVMSNVADILAHEWSPEPEQETPPALARQQRRLKPVFAAKTRYSYRRPAYPVLALSGGAANGAFMAGFIHALLTLREAAIDHCGAKTPSAARGAPAHHHYRSLAKLVEHEYRFGGAAGTSVGSLVAMILDLYFARPPQTLPNALREVFRECLVAAQRAGVTTKGIDSTSRPVQACALAMLQKELTTNNEYDLLCVEPGDITGLMSNRVNMLRFTPLMRNIVQPFVRRYYSLLSQNDFITSVMAVDLQQNTLVGVDERICHSMKAKAPDCMATGILASISEPIFVNPVKRLYLGLAREGQPGAWLDGGLHSGTPVLRALGLAGDGVPVLAINTHRAEGIPAHAPDHAFDVLFSTLGTMVDKTRAWEIALGELRNEERHRKFRFLTRLLRSGDKTLGKRLGPMPWRWQRKSRWSSRRKDEEVLKQKLKQKPARRPKRRRFNSQVAAVFVPATIEPKHLFASGYTFDPMVMKALFANGQRALLDQRRKLLPWLGWDELDRLEASSCQDRCCQGYRRAIEELAKGFLAAKDIYMRFGNVAVLRNHRAARRKLLERKLRHCY